MPFILLQIYVFIRSHLKTGTTNRGDDHNQVASHFGAKQNSSQRLFFLLCFWSYKLVWVAPDFSLSLQSTRRTNSYFASLTLRVSYTLDDYALGAIALVEKV